jgi:hypothetical protein
MIKNLLLLLASIFFIIGVGEWLFPKFIGKLPLRLYGSIDKNLRILAQSSKNNLLPKRYIALTGDSYSVGAGDWLNEVRKSNFFGSPDYSPAHLIFKKTGIDVVSFGQSGAGSFDGIWSEPVTQFLYINSIRGYKLSPPKNFLIFFYEGNDVYDNVQFLCLNLITKCDQQLEPIEFKKIKEFLNTAFDKQLNEYSNNGLWKNMIFTRFLFRGVSNLMTEWFSPNKSLKERNSPYKIVPKGKVNITLLDGKTVRLNEALINGKKKGLPINLQAPAQLGRTQHQKREGIAEELIKLSIYIFEKSITRLASFFPQSKISIIYIPSPISSYKIVSSHIHSRGYMQDVDVTETKVVEVKHIKLCKTIKRFAEFNQFSFVNTTKSLRHAALSDFIHGPVDWDHFNKRGYQVLSDDLAKLFLIKKEGIRMDNCVY